MCVCVHFHVDPGIHIVHVCICVIHICVRVCMCSYGCMEDRGQPQVSFLRDHLPCVFQDPGSITGLEHTDQAWPAGEKAPGFQSTSQTGLASPSLDPEF